MAWYQKSYGSAPAIGDLLAFLDEFLVKNSHWSIHDAAAGTNAKVYRCHDADNNVSFYLYVQDNWAAYARPQMWENWDAVTHTGSGASTTLAYIVKGTTAQTIFISLLDWRFILVMGGRNNSHYVGMLNRADVSKNCPCICVNDSSTETTNPLGPCSNLYFLINELGSVNESGDPVPTQTSEGQSAFRTYDGHQIVWETPIASEQRVQGAFNGAMARGYNRSGLVTGDEVTAGGVRWMALVANSMASLVRMT